MATGILATFIVLVAVTFLSIPIFVFDDAEITVSGRARSHQPGRGGRLVAALLAGMVSFLSPCVLPLVPGYLSAVSGVSVDELEDAGWRRVLIPSLFFVASFSLIFILLGLSATRIGSILSDNRELLDKIAHEPGALPSIGRKPMTSET